MCNRALISMSYFTFRIKKGNISSDALPQRIQEKKEAVRTEAAACEVSYLRIIQRIKIFRLKTFHNQAYPLSRPPIGI